MTSNFNEKMSHVVLHCGKFWPLLTKNRLATDSRIETGNTENHLLMGFICSGMGIIQVLYMIGSFQRQTNK